MNDFAQTNSISSDIVKYALQDIRRCLDIAMQYSVRYFRSVSSSKTQNDLSKEVCMYAKSLKIEEYLWILLNIERFKFLLAIAYCKTFKRNQIPPN